MSDNFFIESPAVKLDPDNLIIKFLWFDKEAIEIVLRDLNMSYIIKDRKEDSLEQHAVFFSKEDFSGACIALRLFYEKWNNNLRKDSL